MKSSWIIYASAVLVVFLAGLGIGYRIGEPTVAPERPAAEVRHKDGSLTVAKDPEVAKKVDAQAPKPELPKGKLVRTTVIKVKPKPVPPKVPVDDACLLVLDETVCPAVTVRLDTTEGPDGTRVTASSPDGEVLGGLDVPRAPLVVAKAHPWSVGVVATSEGHYGGFMDRDLGIFRVGVVVLPGEAHLKFGLRF